LLLCQLALPHLKNAKQNEINVQLARAEKQGKEKKKKLLENTERSFSFLPLQ